MTALHQLIIQKAASLLGSAHSNTVGRENKMNVLLSQFVEGATEEVYLGCDWPFGVHLNTQAQLSERPARKIDDHHIEVDTEPYARIIAVAPSNTNWSIVNGNLTFKIPRVLPAHDPEFLIDLCPRTEIPTLIVGYKKHCEAKANHHHFVNLSAQCLAAQIAYAMYGDSDYAEGSTKQYIVALKSAKQLYEYQLNIDNASKVI